MTTTTERGREVTMTKEEALDRLARRRAMRPPPFDNSALGPGEKPKHNCVQCGYQAEGPKPGEGPVAFQLCSLCRGLIMVGWMSMPEEVITQAFDAELIDFLRGLHGKPQEEVMLIVAQLPTSRNLQLYTYGICGITGRLTKDGELYVQSIQPDPS